MFVLKVFGCKGGEVGGGDENRFVDVVVGQTTPFSK